SARTKFADLKAMADRGEPLPAFAAPDVKVTIDVDNTFEVVTEQLTRNVVGIIDGTDPQLKDTYVLFGAHLDHIGYSQTGGGNLPSLAACRRRGPAALAELQQTGKTPQNPGRGGAAGGRGGAAAPADGNASAPPTGRGAAPATPQA